MLDIYSYRAALLDHSLIRIYPLYIYTLTSFSLPCCYTFQEPLRRSFTRSLHLLSHLPFSTNTTQAHGLGSSNNYYTGTIPTLTAAGYRCITYDLHGSALTPYTFLPQTVSSLATDAIDLMDALSIPTATFVGHSMSGMTGPSLAAAHPDRINGLVLVGPVFPTEAGAKMFDDRIEKVSKGGMEVMADTVPFMAVGSKAQAVHRAFIRELILGMEPAGYIGLCRVIAGAWKEGIRYGDVTAPTLIVAGEEDKSAPMDGCEKILKVLGSKDKELSVMKGVGHWQCVEAPEDTAELITGFLIKHVK